MVKEPRGDKRRRGGGGDLKLDAFSVLANGEGQWKYLMSVFTKAAEVIRW